MAKSIVEGEKEAKLPEVAKHYLVFYFVGLGVSDFAFPVGRFGLKSITAPGLGCMLRNLIFHLDLKSFIVVATACDGASENRTLMQMMMTRPAADYVNGVGSAFNVEWPFDTSTKVAMKHPTRGWDYPIFMLSDMPHFVKK
ncbi:hypothetical protein JL721_13048 [Aureococcus anophagefferens]|nr:hypothetical protein JL721_13048 [Aureococcus anophagefferens]KAH8056314.1 hypothetical protein JL722_7619 [Aureococcus anophagefferens]